MPLPWKEVKHDPLSNFNYAHKRAQQLKNRFARTPGLYEKYKSIIEDHIRKEYVERVETFNEGDKKESWFLPHHQVFNPKKPGKVRVVFYCAARYEGVCLNDCLSPRPDMIADLLGVLFRLRRGAIAMAADIEEMLLQVKLLPSDRSKMRFLWWHNGNLSATPSVYQMTVHPFGGTSSPFCANFALRKTINEFGTSFSEPADKTCMLTTVLHP